MDAKFLIVGDSAISVELGGDISIETNRKVSLLENIIASTPIEGLIETIPTYRSLMLCYDPCITDYHRLTEKCRKLLDTVSDDKDNGTAAIMQIEIPVLYGGELGLDLDAVAEFHGKTTEEVIQIHSSHPAVVYMFGFLPGQAYMGSHNGFTIPRRQSPRLSVTAGSVIIWQEQTIVLPNTSPTGWYVIGHTPIKLFDIHNATDPFLLKMGYQVQFVPVSQKEHDDIQRLVELGEYRCSISERRTA